MNIGAAKVDITQDGLGAVMLGYGTREHVTEGVHTRLYSRAFFIENPNQNRPVAIVVAEIAFFTPSLRLGILKELNENHSHLNLDDHNVLLCAQHTHSGHGGYSYHPFYNVTTPGLKQGILKGFIKTIVESISLAAKNKQSGSIRIGRGKMEHDKKVAFQRSIKAYNLNKDVQPITQETSHLGVNREMILLQFLTEDGQQLGSVNWFAVHPTSIPNTLNKIHADNKGYAALYLESEHKKKGIEYVGAFAQGNAGDVSPNFVYDKSKKYNRYWNGPYIEHDRNALYNGRLQFEKAYEIENQLNDKAPIGDQLDAYTVWKDMSKMDVESKFIDGLEGAVTSPSCLGVAMFIGTRTEGLGFPEFLVPLCKTLSGGVKTYEQGLMQLIKREEAKKIKRKYKAQGVKEIMMETGDNKMFGTKDIKNFVMPGQVDKTIEWIKHFAQKGAFDILPMTPQTLPFQVIRIGHVAIVALPFETTTTAGMRITEMLEDQLISEEIKEVILSPYSNSYNGYITTNEEYQAQLYEGGHTVFGQWSLAAVQQICSNLCDEFSKVPEERNLESDQIKMPTKEELYILEF